MSIREDKRIEILESKNKHLLGQQIVEIKKITPNQYKLIMNVVENLPGLLYTSFTQYFINEDKKDVIVTFLTAGQLAMDEIISVTSTLTGIDKDYLGNETGTDELIEYLFKLSKFNSLDKVIKNLISPLLKPMQAK